MIAYIEKRGKMFMLVLCDKPCNGNEYASAKRVVFADKKSARAYCASNSILPWNF